MKILQDDRIVMTLDAGGTNFVFSAIQGGKEIVKPVLSPSNSTDLNLCLQSIVDGFKQVREKTEGQPAAISFAFPGPADYKSGIIGDLQNLPCFRGGIALGPMLQDIFKIPVFMGNDGDLFTYGEAVAGILPEVNAELSSRNIPKTYQNLFGITLGTGFGGGIVIEEKLCEGDNSAAGEIWLMRNFSNLKLTAEEGVSIRAIQKVYKEITGYSGDQLTPKDIYEIAVGEAEGDQQAAIRSFDEMAVVIGESLANAITLIDGIIVIGGGISRAYHLLLPKIVEHMNSTIENSKGEKMPRLVSKVYNLEDPASYEEFFKFEKIRIKVPFTEKEVDYVPEKRIAVGLSRLDTSQAISLGAYALALDKLS